MIWDDQEPCSAAAAELIAPFMAARPRALNWDGRNLSLRDLVQQTLGASVRVEEEKVGLGFEESAVGESRSNGSAENAVQQVQGQIRVIRDGLEEERVNSIILECTSNIVCQMV